MRIQHLLGDIQLAEPVNPCFATERGELARVLLRHVLHMPQPVVDQAVPAIVERGADAAATVVSRDENVLHPQDIHRVLHDGQAVEIRVHDEVRHVAVDEHLAGQQAHDFIGRHAAVGAADPEILRRLLGDQPGEEPRIATGHLVGPGAVVGEQLGDFAHARGSLTRGAALNRQR